MADGKYDGRLLSLLEKAEGRVSKLIPLASALIALCGVIISKGGDLRIVAYVVGSVTVVALWLIMRFVTRATRTTDLDSDARPFVYTPKERARARAGLIILPVLVAGFIGVSVHMTKQEQNREIEDAKRQLCMDVQRQESDAARIYLIEHPSLNCPPVTVTILKFAGSDAVVDNIRTELTHFLNDQSERGVSLITRRSDDSVRANLPYDEMVDDAKRLGRSAKSRGNLVIWGDLAEKHLWAYAALVDKCNLTQDESSGGVGTLASAEQDNFKFYFPSAAPINSAADIATDLTAFGRFVIGVVLSEQRRWKAALGYLSNTGFRWSAFYKGIALQQTARVSDRKQNLEQAINSYNEFVGPGWEFLQEQVADAEDEKVNRQLKATAVAAYINASNSYVELSDLEPAARVAHLTSALHGYAAAIDLYDELSERDDPKRDYNMDWNWRTIAESDLAVAKIKLGAASAPNERAELIHQAEQDLIKLFQRLAAIGDETSAYWAIAKANFGGLCIELSRIEPGRRKERLNNAEDALARARDVLERRYTTDRDEENEASYWRAVIGANLGAVYTEFATDESDRNIALGYLKQAEDYYKKANAEFFLRDPSYSLEAAKHLSDLGLVLTLRAHWFEDVDVDEAKALLWGAEANSERALIDCGNNLYPFGCASILNSLAYAKRELGKLLADQKRLQESVGLCRKSLDALSNNHLEAFKPMAQRNLGDSLYQLGVTTGNKQTIAAAVKEYRGSLAGLTDQNSSYEWRRTTQALRKAEAR